MEITNLDVCQYCGCVFDFTMAMKTIGDLKVANCPACKQQFELPSPEVLRKLRNTETPTYIDEQIKSLN